MDTFAQYTYTTHRWGWQSSHHWPMLAVFVCIVLALLVLAFEIWMFFDCVLNKKLSDKAKVWWIIGMLLLHPFVAIAYYFIARRGLAKKK